MTILAAKINEVERMGVQNGRVEKSEWRRKQIQLIASETILNGEVVVSELPLVSVPTEDCLLKNPAWVLTQVIVRNTKLLEHFVGLQLKVSDFTMHLDADDLSLRKKMSVLSNLDEKFVQRIYFGFATNNIAYFRSCDRDIGGYGIYPLLSRSNHSCRPNVDIRPGNIKKREVQLVAIKDIEKGEAIAWSYVNAPEFLSACRAVRVNTLLEYFCFACQCDRCNMEMRLKLKE